MWQKLFGLGPLLREIKTNLSHKVTMETARVVPKRQQRARLVCVKFKEKQKLNHGLYFMRQ